MCCGMFCLDGEVVFIHSKQVNNKAKAISAELLKLNLKIKMEERGKTR